MRSLSGCSPALGYTPSSAPACRVGPGSSLVLGGSVVGVSIIGVLPPVGLVLLGAAALGIAGGLLSTVIGVVMTERIPEALRGRVIGTQNAIMTAAPSLGVLGAGVAVELASLATAGLIVIGVWVVTVGSALLAPALRDLEPPPGDGLSTMRSKEVADLAGVSVRTLRHYHQIGALPEPERGPSTATGTTSLATSLSCCGSDGWPPWGSARGDAVLPRRCRGQRPRPAAVT